MKLEVNRTIEWFARLSIYSSQEIVTFQQSTAHTDSKQRVAENWAAVCEKVPSRTLDVTEKSEEKKNNRN